MRPTRVHHEIQQTPDGVFYAVRREFYGWGGRSILVRGSIGSLQRVMDAIKSDRGDD